MDGNGTAPNLSAEVHEMVCGYADCVVDHDKHTSGGAGL